MKIKTSELIGPALNWAVAKCEGDFVEARGRGTTTFNGVRLWINKAAGTYKLLILRDKRYEAVCRQCEDHPLYNNQQFYSPSTDWAQGGPIIEREKITIFGGDEWESRTDVDHSLWQVRFRGPTPLVAAMRCYAASQLGGEVEIPEELC